MSPEERRATRYRTRARQLGGGLAVLALVVLVGGWVLGSDVLKGVIPALGSTMKPVTCLALLSCGLGLGLSREDAPPQRRRWAILLGLTAVLLGALTLVEYGTGWNLGMDLGFFQLGRPPLGRMSPTTAFAFLFGGASLALLDVETRRGVRPAQFLAALCGGTGYLGLTAYLMGSPLLFGPLASIQIALHTALAFLLLALGLVMARPTAGIMGVVIGETSMGWILRHVSPAILLVPLGLGWLRLQGELLGLYDTRTGLSLMILGTVGSLSALLGISAYGLQRREEEHRRMLAAMEAQEVAERRRTEEARRRAEELEAEGRHAQEANRLKGEFLANMSHELRSPLNGILGFAELLADGKAGAVSPQQKEFLEDILTSGRHLLSLINDVLDLSKVEAGRMEFHPRPLHLARTLEETLAVVRSLAVRKRIRISLEADPTLEEVELDPTKFKQVLHNYLSNAIKFTPEGGEIRVRALPEGADRFRVEVEDTGIGISAQDLSRLFTEFQQLDEGSTKGFPGTGLGLALTRRIVEAQGGMVGARSDPGHGSVFFAILPRHWPVPIPEAGMALLALQGLPRVLLVEDETLDRTWLTAALQEAGYGVESATTGAEAVAKGRERPYDALILDLLLPDMSGWDVLRSIRREGPNRDLPVFVTTAVTEKGAGAGFAIHDFLVKPFQSEDLLASLARAGVFPGRPVLLVDDDPMALQLARNALGDAGYPTIGCLDGPSGLAAVEVSRPAALVLDLMMPGMNGFEFLKRLRTLEVGRHLPVIIWTAKDLSEAERSRLRLAASALVLKGDGGAGGLLEELESVLGRAGHG